jgi:hypothetical protein
MLRFFMWISTFNLCSAQRGAVIINTHLTIEACRISLWWAEAAEWGFGSRQSLKHEFLVDQISLWVFAA